MSNVEIWRDIAGYEGLYQVSNWGNVRSLDHVVENKYGYRIVTGKNRKNQTRPNGYLFVMLSKKSKQNGFDIHRLVATAFLDNPQKLPCVNHKDENKKNNCVENLEWCDYKYNSNYGMAAKQRCVPVIGVNIYNGNTIALPGIKDGAKYGFIPCQISKCLAGTNKTHKNYQWSYATPGFNKIA